MTDELKRRVNGHLVGAGIAAVLGGGSGATAFAVKYGELQERVSNQAHEQQVCRDDRVAIWRTIAEVQAAQKAHQVDSDTKWGLLKPRLEELLGRSRR